jgi:hypothetical protein
VLNLPQYQELSAKSEEVYRDILEYLSWEFNQNFKIVFPMLKMILKFKPVNQVVFEGTLKTVFCIPKQDIRTNPAAQFVIRSIDYGGELNEERFRYLFDAGFSMEETAGCVSPLTIFVALLCGDACEEYEKLHNLLHKFIEHGVNVESSVITFLPESTEYMNIKNELLIPDVLLLSLVIGIEKLVHIFIPYWWATPLALLYFHHIPFDDFLCEWFNMLECYGAIPHGTRLFKLVDATMRNKLENGRGQQEDEAFTSRIWPKYQELVGMHQSCITWLSFCLYHSVHYFRNRIMFILSID